MIEADKNVITHISWQVVDHGVIALSIRKLQNRIVKAKMDGRTRMVKKLQSLLVKSLHARVLAVKRVSENKGKNTAGIDGKLLNTDSKKMKCVNALKNRSSCLSCPTVETGRDTQEKRQDATAWNSYNV